MVVVDVTELEVLDGVELDGEDVVSDVAVVVGVEKAEVLTGKSAGEGGGGGDDEGEPMAAKFGVLRDDGEGEGSGEGEDSAITGVLEKKRGWIEGMADESGGLVGETEDTVGLDLGDAVEADVGVGAGVVGASSGEAGVNEVWLLGEYDWEEEEENEKDERLS